MACHDPAHHVWHHWIAQYRCQMDQDFKEFLEFKKWKEVCCENNDDTNNNNKNNNFFKKKFRNLFRWENSS